MKRSLALGALALGLSGAWVSAQDALPRQAGLRQTAPLLVSWPGRSESARAAAEESVLRQRAQSPEPVPAPRAEPIPELHLPESPVLQPMMGSIPPPWEQPRYCYEEQTWVRVEYLGWWPRGMPLPPLVTTSPADAPPEDAGVLGRAGTDVIFGGNRVGDSMLSGGRLTAGYWLDCQQQWGVEASAFALETDPEEFSAGSAGVPILARPFVNADPLAPGQAADPVAYPGAFSGTIAINARSSFWGLEAYGRHELCCERTKCDPFGNPFGEFCMWLDVLAGARYLRLREDLSIAEDVVATDPASAVIPVGTRFEVRDVFDTKNDFVGPSLGLSAGARWGNWSLEGTGKLAFGPTRQQVTINGVSRTTVPGLEPVILPGGLLAQPSNIGRYTVGDFGFVPELALRLVYHPAPMVRCSVGYSVLYWDHVVRPGEQIDLQVNATQIGGNPLFGSPRPEFDLRDSSFWVHGLNAGVELRF